MYTSIIILTYNKLEYTKLCIESIRNHTKNVDYELIIIDNHSTDGTIEWLKKQNDIRKIYNNENLGFPKGCNQGIEIAKGDNVLLLNNDTIVTHNWLKNLINCLYSSPEIGAVGAVTNNCSYHQAIEVNYNSIEEINKFALSNNISNPDKWEERLKLIGFCMLIKRKVIDKIGSLDERFTPGIYEDADYAVRIRRAGYQLMLCKDVFIHHFGSAYFQEHQEEYMNLFKVNGNKFLEKWGYDPGYSMNIRQEMLDLMDLPDESLRVLEVGCASGGTLLQIKNKYPDADLHGIELNGNAATDGKAFAKIIAANIETTTLPYPERHFDYIILADILEHLQNPWGTLETLYKYLTPNGKILASLPNIMHVSIVKSLLNGSWTYEESGIMDRTHLRFFTLSEIQKMFNKVGFSDVRYNARQAFCSEQDEEFISALPIADATIKNQLKAYQYFIRADKGFPIGDLVGILSDLEKMHNVEENMGYLNHYDMNKIIECIQTLHVNQSELYNLIAVTNFSMRVYENVIPYLQAALRINSNDSSALYNLAYVLYQLKEYDEALLYIGRIENKDEDVSQLLQKILEEKNS